MLVLAAVLIQALISAFTTLIRGLILYVLWGWFMEPIFKLPHLNIPAAIGIAIVFSCLTRQNIPYDKSASELVVEEMLFAVIQSIMCLTVGWIMYMSM